MCDDKALVTRETQAVTSPAGLAPVYSGQQMAEALTAYKELQRVLDEKMPDQIMTIGKGKSAKMFRKKGYWRATQVAFGLDLDLIEEALIHPTATDWGYIVTYRATAPNGRSMVGDGSCMASEKQVLTKDWVKWRKDGSSGKPPYVCDDNGLPVVDKEATAENATVHNVRSHAHTRAKNRAISDLVGFGEVSAEEINRNGDRWGDDSGDRQTQQKTAQRRADTTAKPTPPKQSPSDVLKTRHAAIMARHKDVGEARLLSLLALCKAWNGGKSDGVTLDTWMILIGGAEKGMDDKHLDECLRFSDAGEDKQVGNAMADYFRSSDEGSGP